MTLTIPHWLIPIGLSALLYAAAELWYRSQRTHGLTGLLDGMLAGIVWAVGTLVILVAYLFVRLLVA